MNENNNYSENTISRENIRGGANIERRIIQQAKRLAEKLNKEIEKGNDNLAFIIAISLALIKDFLDIVLDILLIGEIPGVGFLTGLFLTTFLFFFMLKKGWFLKTKIKVYFWILGFFIDGLPLVNALPMNTLLVLYAWRLTKKRAAKGKLKLANLNNLTENEIGKLDNDISLLESDEQNNINIRRRKNSTSLNQNGIRPPRNSTE